jgi:VIT1/CCC1 family predicted Fe2+/Mn2+ transporter
MPPPPIHDERWHRAGSGATLRNFVLGTSDGLVTVLAFVAGVSASLGKAQLVLLAGIAEMFAGALSMGLGAYMGGRAEHELYHRERSRELREMREVPWLEREEVRDIYRKKGFHGHELELVVDRLTENPQRWLDEMMTGELGLSADPPPSPVRAGLIVAISYMLAALVPLFPYALFHMRLALLVSLTATALALGVLGAVKADYTGQSRTISALQSILLGAVGTGACYGIGLLAHKLVPH